MKTFDQPSIQARLEVALKAAEPRFTRILRDSAVSSLLYSISESEAEIVRYFEYLFRESKWNYAQNVSSLMTMANFLGYKPKRKVSAAGFVYVSHSPLLANAGLSTSSVFDVSDLTAFRDIAGEYSGSGIILPVGQQLITTTGVNYIVREMRRYERGDSCVEVPVLQGIKRSYALTNAQGTAFESIKIENPNIEAASSSLSSGFFRVFIHPNNLTLVEAKRYENIRLAQETEYAYDITDLPDRSGVVVRFGDGNSGRRLPPGATVNIECLETSGEGGTVEERYQITRFVTQPSTTTMLYVTNLDPVLGGRTYEDIEDIKVKAPNQYLIGGSVITTADYKAALLQIPSVLKANAYAGSYEDPDTAESSRVIYVTAINTQTFPSNIESLNEDLLDIIADRKSPLDRIITINPDIIELKLQAKARTSSDSSAYKRTQQDLYNATLAKFGVLAWDYKKPYYPSDFIALLKKDSTIYSATPLIEAVKNIPPSQFKISTRKPGYYEYTFKFNPSLFPLKSFSEKPNGYCLKINILTTCVGCETKNRTLLVRWDKTEAPTAADITDMDDGLKLHQYPYISSITDQEYLNTKLSGLTEYTSGADYVPFQLEFSYKNLTIRNSLGEGTLFIPKVKANGDSYLNFEDASNSLLDEAITIEVIAEPVNYEVIPTEENEYIKVASNDILIEVGA